LGFRVEIVADATGVAVSLVFAATAAAAAAPAAAVVADAAAVVFLPLCFN